MQTIIKIKTYMCPRGLGRLGEPNACRYHRAAHDIEEGAICPIHKLALLKARLPEDKITHTIMGEEHIEHEIVHLEYDAHHEKGTKNLEEIKQELGESAFHEWHGSRLTRLDRKADVSTPEHKDKYREKRKQDIRDAIIRSKQHEDK